MIQLSIAVLLAGFSPGVPSSLYAVKMTKKQNTQNSEKAPPKRCQSIYSCNKRKGEA
jgi:hypothetical protein